MMSPHGGIILMNLLLHICNTVLITDCASIANIAICMYSIIYKVETDSRLFYYQDADAQ